MNFNVKYCYNDTLDSVNLTSRIHISIGVYGNKEEATVWISRGDQHFYDAVDHTLIQGKTYHCEDWSVDGDNGGTIDGYLSVKHNSDGTISSAPIKIGIRDKNGTNGAILWNNSFTPSLSPIPIAGEIDLARSTEFGGNCDILFDPKGKDLWFDFTFSLGGWTGKSATRIKSSDAGLQEYCDFKIPLEAAEEIPDRNIGTMTVVMNTYASNSTKTIRGSSKSTFTVSLPDKYIPSIEDIQASIVHVSDKIAPIFSGSNQAGKALSGFSRVRIEASADGIYGSTIEKFTITGGYVKSVICTLQDKKLDYTGDAIYASGNITFNVTCMDSRARISESREVIVPFIQYYPPRIDKFISGRYTIGSNIYAELAATWSNGGEDNVISDSNICTAIIKYRKSGESKDSWTRIAVNGIDSWKSGAETIRTGIQLNDSSSYVFRIIVTDQTGTSVERDTFISARQVLMDFRKGGKGLGIGKVCESDAMEVAMDTQFYGGISINDKSIEDYIRDVVCVVGSSMYGDEVDRPKSGKIGQVFFQRIEE